MATRAELKLFGLRSDAQTLREAANVVRRHGWAPKVSTAMKRLADEITAEADALTTATGPPRAVTPMSERAEGIA